MNTPPKKLIVCIWPVQTHVIQNLSIEARLACLGEALRASRGAIDASPMSDGIAPRGLFVAPEYLFARPIIGRDHGNGDIRQIEEAYKNDLLTEMLALSLQVPDLLIITGTVAWRRPFAGPDGTTTRRVGKVGNSIEQAAIWKYGGDESRAKFVTAGRHGMLGRVGSVDGPNFLAKNTAYVLYGGKVKFKYHKRTDYQEVLEHRTIYEPGTRDGRFTVSTDEIPARAIQFGLEVCLDHAERALARTPNEEVDVHVITSASIPFTPTNAITKPNGYLVHADCDLRHCEVLMRGGARMPARQPGATPDSGDDLRVPISHETLAPFEPLRRDPVKLAPLQFYELTLTSVPDAEPMASSSSGITATSAPGDLPLPAAAPSYRIPPVTRLSSPVASSSSSSTATIVPAELQPQQLSRMGLPALRIIPTTRMAPMAWLSVPVDGPVASSSSRIAATNAPGQPSLRAAAPSFPIPPVTRLSFPVASSSTATIVPTELQPQQLSRMGLPALRIAPATRMAPTAGLSIPVAAPVAVVPVATAVGATVASLSSHANTRAVSRESNKRAKVADESDS